MSSAISSIMRHVRDPMKLTKLEIEEIEKQSLRYLYTAAYDFGFDAVDIFRAHLIIGVVILSEAKDPVESLELTGFFTCGSE